MLNQTSLYFGLLIDLPGLSIYYEGEDFFSVCRLNYQKKHHEQELIFKTVFHLKTVGYNFYTLARSV